MSCAILIPVHEYGNYFSRSWLGFNEIILLVYRTIPMQKCSTNTKYYFYYY